MKGYGVLRHEKCFLPEALNRQAAKIRAARGLSALSRLAIEGLLNAHFAVLENNGQISVRVRETK